MPNVKGKKYPYTPAGMLAANKAKRGMGQGMSKPMSPMSPMRPMARPMARPMRPMPRPLNPRTANPFRKKGSGGARRMSTPGMGNMLKGKGRGY